MTDYNSPLITVTVIDPMPSWLSNQPLNKWVDVPGSKVITSFARMQTAPTFPRSVFVNAGLVGTGPNEGALMWAPGQPTRIPAFQHMWGYSGLWYRPASSEIGHAAPGGAGCHNGNEIMSIQVLAESPAWTCKVLPSDVSQLWAMRLDPPHAYMKDGRPNAAHRYMSPQFNPILDRLLLVGTRNVWENDSTWFSAVGRWQYGASDYSPQGTEPAITFGQGVQGYDLQVTDPATGIVYSVWSNTLMSSRDPSTGQITQPVTGFSNTPAYIVARRLQLTQGNWCWWRRSNGQYGVFGISGNYGGNTTFWCFDISNHVWIPLTNVTGTASWLAAMAAGGSGYLPDGVPVGYDPIAEEFLLYSDAEQTLYRLVTNWSNRLTMSPIAMTGTPPAVFGGGMFGDHLFYLRNANTIALVTHPAQPIKLVRRH